MTDDDRRGRPSRIEQVGERLPAIKADVDRMLRDGATQAEICRRTEAPLAEAGEAPFSRSSMNRYALAMELFGRRVREARHVADALVEKFGERPTGEIGQLTIEMLRIFAFELIVRADEDPEQSLDAKDIREWALAMERLERAEAIGRTRERGMRAELAAQAERIAVGRGIGEDTAAEIRAAIEGAAA